MLRHMKFEIESGCLELIDEGEFGYVFGSSDNLRRYPQEMNLSTEPRPNISVGVLMDGRPKLVVGTFGGLTRLHEHAAVLVDEQLFVALAGLILCLNIRSLTMDQTIEADPMTCFGVYFEPNRNALISHGELEVARFNLNGTCVWRTSGPDIWTGPFEVRPDAIHATIWDETPARIDYETGAVTILKQ